MIVGAEPAVQEHDTVQTIESAKVVVVQPKVARYSFDAVPKDPLASLFFSVTLPGAGQFYNREYGRGVAVAASFYASGWLFKRLMDRWTALNTDTFYVEEVDKDGLPTGRVRKATAMRAEEDMQGLPQREKALLLVSGSVAAAAYIFGIIDAVLGAKRYNRKLVVGRLDNFDVKLCGDLPARKMGLQMSCDFR